MMRFKALQLRLWFFNSGPKGHAGLTGGLIAGKQASFRRCLTESDSANLTQLVSADGVG
jgi:hypothetical protein